MWRHRATTRTATPLEDRVALEADEAGAIVVLDDSAVVGVFVEHAYEAAGPDLELG